MTAAEAVAHALTGRDDWGCVEARLPEAHKAAQESDARRSAGELLGPLDGVPFAVKANLDVAGLSTTAGTGVVRDAANRDADVVAHLRGLGAIPVVTTTLAEAAIGSVTINPHTGTCVSPHDVSRNAGGSSGGSAAAVAGGLVQFALGTDTMGSVRIPAACCGIAGWKPTRGALSLRGLVPLSTPLDTVGVLAPTCADLLLIAEELLAGDDSDPAPIVRVGIASFTADADASAQDAIATAAGQLRTAGCTVSHVGLTIDTAMVRRRGLLLCEAEASQFRGAAVDGDPPGLSEGLRALMRFGRDAGPESVSVAEQVRADVEAVVRSALFDVDVLLLPTLPGPPPARDEDPADLADFTAFVNLAGVPAVSVPTSVTATGEDLPRSVQLVGRHGADLALLRLALAVRP